MAEYIRINALGARSFWEVIKEKIGFTTRILAVEQNLAAKANATQQAWQNLTLINGAADGSAIDDVAYPPAYHKDTLGFVRLRGLVSWNSTANSTIFAAVLPVGYRPSRKLNFSIPGENFVEIFPTGEIRVSESSTASSAFWSIALENCPTFFAEQ